MRQWRVYGEFPGRSKESLCEVRMPCPQGEDSSQGPTQLSIIEWPVEGYNKD
ncbi:MAG: hypothetical protein ACP5O5_01315 [Fervidicoccaceae archaeon]